VCGLSPRPGNFKVNQGPCRRWNSGRFHTTSKLSSVLSALTAVYLPDHGSTADRLRLCMGRSSNSFFYAPAENWAKTVSSRPAGWASAATGIESMRRERWPVGDPLEAGDAQGDVGPSVDTITFDPHRAPPLGAVQMARSRAIATAAAGPAILWRSKFSETGLNLTLKMLRNKSFWSGGHAGPPLRNPGRRRGETARRRTNPGRHLVELCSGRQAEHAYHAFGKPVGL